MSITPQHRFSDLAGTEAELTKPIVLIVDDEPLNRLLITEALAIDNYCLVEADNGAAAIAYMSQHNADLVLLDIDMPGMNGLATCEAIRALAHAKLVPIVIVTGLDDTFSIERAFDSGATDFLTKPVNWALMRQRVRFMLRHGAITRKLQRNEQILDQVHDIVEIGHWHWDASTRLIERSPGYRRLVPRQEAVVHDSILNVEPNSDTGRLILSHIKEALREGEQGFRFECGMDHPTRGRRRLRYHGTIEYRDGKAVYMLCTVQDITQRRRDEERFAAIFEASPVGILEADVSNLLEIVQKPGFFDFSEIQLRAEILALMAKYQENVFVIKANPAAQRMFLLDNAQSESQMLRVEMTLKFLAAIRDRQSDLRMQWEVPQQDGGIRCIIANTHLPQTPDEYSRVVISMNDVSDLVQREAQLRRADAIIVNSADAVAVMDKNKRLVDINPAYTRLTGYTLDQLQKGDLLQTRLPGRGCHETAPIIAEFLKYNDYWRGEIELQRRDGSWMPAIVQIQIIRNDRGDVDGFVSITSDISQIKESERRLSQLAHFDALTGLPNRLSLQERLQSEFNAVQRTSFALLYIDLDGFKLVNDSMGHPTGDALLREVSQRLAASCRPNDLLTRIGGDEFALLMLNGAPIAEIDAQAERIFAALNVPFTMQGRQIFIGASIGACRYPEDARNAEEMLRNADSAMYEAKRLGRGQLCYYSSEFTSASNHRLQIENELRVAIASDELFLMYQPKYEAASSRIIGAEALVRWRNPRRGVVPPGEFIAIAEASGLIVPLGEWVINEACRQLAEWQRQCRISIPIAINISALHLREQSLLRVIAEAIERFAIDPQLIEIEITEDSLDFRGQDDSAYDMLHRLSALGLSIAIDDFGTGFSSLSQLKKMPISTLKIDGSFVRDIASSESDRAIITAIVGLAKTLDMDTVAEGVESEEQARRLRSLECDVLQGFLYSKPLSADDFLQKFLAQDSGAD